jgi:uncharacterized protein (DUF433 family)
MAIVYRKLCRNIVQSSNALFRVWFPKLPFLVYNGHQLLLQEAEMDNLTRITFDPQVMGGKPCIRGMRVTVGTMVGLIASGETVDDVLADYPYGARGYLGGTFLCGLESRRKRSANDGSQKLNLLVKF